MKPLTHAFIALAMTSFAAVPAAADCLDKNTTASTSEQPKVGIAKDGTHAPLEGDAKTALNVNPAQKDGKTMPLATEEGGGNKNLATSQQDVEAQQKGGETAAAAAKDDRCPD
jgi:hypothetical protein